jgi:hypothetical protein
MPVENKYTDAATAAGNRAHPLVAGAAQGSYLVAPLVVAAADDDGSVFRVAKSVPVSLVVSRLQATVRTAITGGTDYDVGVYRTDLGAVLDKDLFSAGNTLASLGTVDLLGNVNAARCNMTIAELFFAINGTQIGVEEVDIALTGDTVGTGAGNAVIHGLLNHW